MTYPTNPTPRLLATLLALALTIGACSSGADTSTTPTSCKQAMAEAETFAEGIDVMNSKVCQVR